ncbi:hypothetical protein BT96DRAFT_944936 [Gymnopus androsaceus JB14]|uniref:Uncharacterized protein n=1 Tax=Gymnopus androsaceus JB14 TaxID=1447944 RepID=A0A6A4H2X3_9AGAR|nr:hypothetical protein BT96DRAFT_944936 [Gymnopus androsaceus JB14]
MAKSKASVTDKTNLDPTRAAEQATGLKTKTTKGRTKKNSKVASAEKVPTNPHNNIQDPSDSIGKENTVDSNVAGVESNANIKKKKMTKKLNATVSNEVEAVVIKAPQASKKKTTRDAMLEEGCGPTLSDIVDADFTAAVKKRANRSQNKADEIQALKRRIEELEGHGTEQDYAKKTKQAIEKGQAKLTRDKTIVVAARYEGAQAADARNKAHSNNSNANPNKRYIGHVTDNKCHRDNIIIKPEGEVGEKKRGGYTLSEELGGITKTEYNKFLDVVHRAADKAHVNFTVSYKDQLLKVKDDVCKLVALEEPYFTRNRFPQYWATLAALKQYIGSVQRAESSRNRKLQAESVSGSSQTLIHIDGEEESDEEEEEEEEEEEDECEGDEMEINADADME